MQHALYAFFYLVLALICDFIMGIKLEKRANNKFWVKFEEIGRENPYKFEVDRQ